LSTTEGTISDAFGGVEWGLLVGIALIWGSSFLWIDIGLDSLRPGVIALARVLLGIAVLSCFPQARKRVAPSDLGRIAMLGLLWMGIPLSLFPIAQQWVDSSIAGMMNGAVPLTTAARATLLLGRLPGRVQLLGLVLGFAGVVAISWPKLASSGASAAGIGLIGIAVFLYGLAANLAVPLQQRYGALPVLLRALLASLVIILPFGLAQMPGSKLAWAPVLAMLPLGLLGTGLAFVMMIALVGRVGSTRGVVPVYFVAPVAIAFGVAVRADVIDPSAWIGTALVIAGGWLTSRRDTAAAPTASKSTPGDVEGRLTDATSPVQRQPCKAC